MDTLEYSAAVNRYIESISMKPVSNNSENAAGQTKEMSPQEEIPFIGEPDELCELLGIACVESTFYDTMLDRKMNRGKQSILYKKSEDGDRGKALTVSETTSSGSPVLYTLIPYDNDSGNNTDIPDEYRIAFGHLIHLALERERSRRIAEQFMFRDREMDTYNLPFFLQTVSRMIESHSIGGYNTCRFNMQRFASVNLQVGRQKASELMRRYVRMLQTKIGDTGYVCRIGGDNFIALYHKSFQTVVEEHISGVHMVYDDATGEAILLSAYAGYFFIPADILRATDVMDNVSAAAAQSKLDHLTTQVYYDSKLTKMQEHKKMIESLFPKALEDEEFLVYYQPKINLNNYSMIGAEALCRWRHKGDIIIPESFIPILEQTTAVCRLDFYMLDHVCRDMRRWLDEGKKPVRVSVNLSRRHLGTSHLLENLLQIIDSYSLPHELFEVELTETTTDVDFHDLKEIVFGLQEAGINTSVDDFGIGYSSMNLIRDLPWNVLKIDKSFLPDMDNPDAKLLTMLKYLISMAQEMGLECIVEGVESQDQINLLKKYGCYLAQGFFFDRPLPVSVFEQRLEDN
ncbi:MAG: GGDEF domain-containing protein [Eubacterium sp.]|nr:GGDEF domain-containing protein [Eubacterium sp.]